MTKEALDAAELTLTMVATVCIIAATVVAIIENCMFPGVK